MQIACVLITHMPVKVELMRHPEIYKQPVIITKESPEGLVAFDSSPEAYGVTSGMSIRDALSICNKAILIEFDEDYYNEIFSKTMIPMIQKIPRIELSGLGCIYLEINDPLSDELTIASSLLKEIPIAFNPRIGLAESKFPAYVTAITSNAHQATQIPIDIPNFFAKLPVTLLPISSNKTTQLKIFGLNTMGQLAKIPLGSLQAQFGTEGKLAWELCNGIDDRPLIPMQNMNPIMQSVTFPAPVTTFSIIIPALSTLLKKLFASAELKGKYIRSIAIEAIILNCTDWYRKIVFKNPVNSAEKAMFALKNSMDTIKFPGPIEGLQISATEISYEAGIQRSMLADVRKHDQLKETLAQLEARLRIKPPIYSVIKVDPWSRIPERRQALIQFAY